MPDSTISLNPYLEVLFSDHPRKLVPVNQLPFLIGRGQENGNYLSLEDLRISRRCAVISAGASGISIEDLGQRGGIFVNGEPVKFRLLAHGDRIRLGTDDGCQLIFHLPSDTVSQEQAETQFRSILESLGSGSSEELNGLRLLLEATSLMNSQLPLESVLATMLDHAIVITQADRGMLLEPDASGVLQVKIARGRGGEGLAAEAMHPSRSVLNSAIELQAAVVNEDLNLADVNLQGAQSVMLQLLRSSVVIPLYGTPRAPVSASSAGAKRQLLGAVYLDSKRVATFSTLDRKILDALGAQAGSILEKARLIEQERERQRLEQELDIAREIQQALIPQGLKEFERFSITGIHRPCYEVGGDYFDVCPLSDGRIAVLIADVAGKGLGAALLTTMLQGALSGMTLGVDPVRVFDHLNRFLCDRAAVGRYATMFFGLLQRDGSFEFVRAGHPPPLLLRQGTVSDLYSTGSFPIGLVEEACFESTRIQLELGDTLLLYTDGVTEAENRNKELFEEERLKEAFRRYGTAPLKDVQAGILSAVEKFAEGASQSDDVTLLVVRYRGPADIA